MRIPGNILSSAILIAGSTFRSPLVRLVARRFGLAMPAARLLTAGILVSLATVQRVRKLRRRLSRRPPNGATRKAR